jgi:hypothetical protein
LADLALDAHDLGVELHRCAHGMNPMPMISTVAR